MIYIYKKVIVSVALIVAVVLLNTFTAPSNAKAICIFGFGSTCSDAQNAAVNEGRDPNPTPTPSTSSGCANGMYKQPDGSCNIFVGGPPPEVTPTTITTTGLNGCIMNNARGDLVAPLASGKCPDNSTPFSNSVPTTQTNGNLPPYIPLEPIPGIDQSGQANFGQLLSQIFKILIIAGQVITVVAFVYYGIMYMFSETGGKLDDAKKHLWGAVVGLLLLIGSWLILFTINPQLIAFSGGLNPQTGNYSNITQPKVTPTLTSEGLDNCTSSGGSVETYQDTSGSTLTCDQAKSQGKIPSTSLCNQIQSSKSVMCVIQNPTAIQRTADTIGNIPPAGYIGQ